MTRQMAFLLALVVLAAPAVARTDSNWIATNPPDAFPPASGSAWIPFREAKADSGIEPLLSARYARLAIADLRHLATAPARWERGQWLHVGLVTAGVIGAAALLDEPIRDAIGHDPDRSYGVVKDVEHLGEARRTIPLLGLFYVSGLALDDDRAKAVALDGLITRIIASRLVTSNLKHAFGRARPQLERGAGQFAPFEGEPEHGSFPSGHATEAFAIASVVAEHYADHRWTPWIAYGLASVVGYARVKHDRHWTSDVVAGALIGSSVGRAVVRFNRTERAGAGATVDVRDGGLVLAWSF